MGNTCCCKKKIKKKIVLLLVGLDNAGKTVAVKGLAGESLNTVVPTVGFSVVNLQYLSYNVKIFDLGGGANIRGIWHKYFVDAHGIIFVVDSSDFSRFDEAKNALQDILSSEKISGKPLLILANKQDHEYALDEIDIIENLNIEFIVNSQKCPTLVECCTATEISNKNKIDPGIKRGYQWLMNYIVQNYECLNQRVEIDVKEQEKLEKQEMLQKIERIKLMKEIERKKKEHDEDAIESYSDYARKLNGEANEAILKVDSLYNSLEMDDTNISDKSSDSFPAMYHTNISDTFIERPKSAVEVVKQHLQLNEIKKKSILLRANKTIPASTCGVKLPRSASEKRRDYHRERRNLKSAGDSALDTADFYSTFSMGPSGDDFHKELFELNNLNKNKRLLSLEKNGNENGISWIHKPLNGDNAVSVLDID